MQIISVCVCMRSILHLAVFIVGPKYNLRVSELGRVLAVDGFFVSLCVTRQKSLY